MGAGVASLGVGGVAGRQAEPSGDDPVRLDWPSQRRTAGNNPLAAPGSRVDSELDDHWSAFRTASPSWTVAGGGLVFNVGGSTVTAFVEATGEVAWETSLSDTVDGGPALSDGVLLVPEDSGFLAGLAADTGEELFRTELARSGGATVTAADGTAYLADWASLLAFDISDRTTRRLSAPGRIKHPPAVVDGTVLVIVAGSERDRLVALENGSVRWERSLYGRAVDQPAVTDQGAFVPNGDRISAFEVVDGGRRWSRGLESVPLGVAVASGVVVGITLADEIYGLGADSGAIRWTEELSDIARVAPTMTDASALVFDEEGTVHALGLDGQGIRWEADAVGVPQRPPPVGPSVLAVDDGTSIEVYRSPGSIGPRETIAELLTERDRVGAVGPEIEDVIDAAQEAYVNGAYDRAERRAQEGIDLLAARSEARSAAADVISQLERGIENADFEAPAAESALTEARESFQAGDYESARTAAERGLDTLARTRESAAEARAAIDDLAAAVDDREAVPTDAAESALADAREAFQAGEYGAATDRAREGLATLREAADRAASADEAIDSLATAIDETGPDIETTEASALLDEARTAYDRGDYETARSRAEEGREALRGTVENARTARDRIDELRDAIAATDDDIRTPDAADRLAAAEAAFESGEYETAARRAEAGLEALAETTENARAARDRIDELRSAIADVESFQPSEARSLLEEARNRYEAGDYVQAHARARTGLQQLSETREAAADARAAIEEAASVDRHAGIDATADAASYDDLLADARRAYENGAYRRAERRANAARDRYRLASIAVDGGMGSALLGGGLLYKKRPDLFERARERAVLLFRDD